MLVLCPVFLDGPRIVTPLFVMVCFRFKLFRRYSSHRPEEVDRVHRQGLLGLSTIRPKIHSNDFGGFWNK